MISLTKEQTPAHLWPEHVRCRCGAQVAKATCDKHGRVQWICENGHDDVADQFLAAAEAKAGQP